MKKATIKCIEVCDRLATTYDDKEQLDTIIEVIVSTSATIGDRVRLPELDAERSVIKSRWVRSVKVVHFTAAEWLYLRGLRRCPPDVLDDARELMLDK